MNRNSIRTKVKVATCCLAGAVMISGGSFVSNAAVTAGASSFTSVVAEAVVGGTNTTAGVTFGLSQYLAEKNVQSAEKQATEKQISEAAEAAVEAETTEAVEAETTEDAGKDSKKAKETETTAEAEKSEFADIGVSNVDEESYINIRSEANTDSEVVGKLYSKSAVTVLGTEGEWYRIHSGNCEGYIKCEYVITGDEELAKSISTRVAIVETDNLNIRDNMSTEGTVLGQVNEGDQLIVVEELDGWVKVATDEGEGYVSSEYVRCRNHYKVAESKEEEEARLQREEEARRAANRKSSNSSSSSSSSSNADGGSAKTYNPPSGGSGQSVVDYACQFVGNPYRYGGTSLTDGADCSGFVMSVYAAFGVGLPHSSSALRSVGYEVSSSDMQPGDIVCYSGHVAIYVGGGTIVHASTAETGIKYSSATYRDILTVRRIF